MLLPSKRSVLTQIEAVPYTGTASIYMLISAALTQKLYATK